MDFWSENGVREECFQALGTWNGEEPNSTVNQALLSLKTAGLLVRTIT